MPCAWTGHHTGHPHTGNPYMQPAQPLCDMTFTEHLQLTVTHSHNCARLSTDRMHGHP